MNDIENNKNELIECLECKLFFKEITNTHLKKHNLTIIEYKNRYNLNNLKSNHCINKLKLCRKGSELSEKTKMKISESWTEERKEKIRIMGKNNKNKHLTAEHKSKISKYLKGKTPWNAGKKLPNEMKLHIGNSLKKSYAEGRRNVSKKYCDTKPEQKVEQTLQKMNLNYIKQFKINSKSYDFCLIDIKIMIEVDGRRYHDINAINAVKNIQENVKNDLYKNQLAKENGYKIVRVWEDEIDKVWRVL